MPKTIILFCGIPGSGKSTYYENNIKPTDPLDCSVFRINADSIRKKMYGDENIQGNGKQVFDEVYLNFREALQNDEIKTIVIDNTNISFKVRKNYYKLIKQYYTNDDYKIELVFFYNHKLAKERNNLRERVVPDDVMMRMELAFEGPNPWETSNCKINGIEK